MVDPVTVKLNGVVEVQTVFKFELVVPPVGVPERAGKSASIKLSRPISVTPKSDVASNLKMVVAEVDRKFKVSVLQTVDTLTLSILVKLAPPLVENDITRLSLPEVLIKSKVSILLGAGVAQFTNRSN